MRLLQKSCNHDVAANFSLRVFSIFSALQTQAKACGYQNRTFARASFVIDIVLKVLLLYQYLSACF
jgi:hypothetical protein